MNYKIAQLILTPGQKINSTCEVFVSQPDANKETLAGKLFALIELESKRADDLKVINFLINNLNYNYYQSEKMILRERLSNIKVEHIFESALAKTNKKFVEFLQSEKIKLNQNLMNITVGVICKDSLHFSNLGKNKALMIYKNKTENKEQKYKLADITEQTKSEIKKQINLVKLFSNVVSGSIPPGGYFIFTNETLPEYLSNKQLIEIISTLPPASAVEQIKNILVKINDYIPFLAIIIKNTLGQETLEQKKETTTIASTQTSLANLNQTEAVTEKLLTPSGLINFKKWGLAFNRILGRFNPSPADKPSNYTIWLKKKPNWLAFRKIFTFIKNIFLSLFNLLAYLFNIISDRNKMDEVYHAGKDGLIKSRALLKNHSYKTVSWYKNLTNKNKVLLAGFLIIFLIFIGDILWLSFRNKSNEKQQLYDNLIKTIEQKQNQIDASLLYSNEAGAKNILDEVKTLLAQLPTKTKEQQTLYDKFVVKNTSQTEKINHIIKVESSTLLADFINLNSQAKPNNIIKVKGKIYAADAAQKSIYSLELNNKLITAITDIKQPISQLNFPVIDDKDRIYYFNDKNIIVLDGKTDEINSLTLVSGSNEISAMAGYSNKLYLLDSTNSQLYRYSNLTSGLTNPTAWIKDKVNLSKAVSLDIDGNVYLLQPDGQVLKFLKGKLQTFNLNIVDPPLKETTKISVSQEQKYIYLLEPTSKRLVVFDKTGKFLSQYIADQFNDLKDFIVDEAAKKIYFLNGTSIYVIDAKHFD